MTTPNSFENTPIDAKDGTLRYFLSLPDGSDNETQKRHLFIHHADWTTRSDRRR